MGCCSISKMDPEIENCESEYLELLEDLSKQQAIINAKELKEKQRKERLEKERERKRL